MDTRAEYAGVAPPPPPIVPEASAPVPVVDGKRGLSGAGAGSGPLTFADTVGDIVPTVGQAAAPLAISEGARGDHGECILHRFPRCTSAVISLEDG